MITFRKDDYGFTITVIVRDRTSSALDISASTTRDILFRKPDGTVVSKSAAFDSDGVDGKLTYTVESGLLDQVGVWRLEPQLSSGSFGKAGTFAHFKVDSKLTTA